jgi:NADPH:quinone reductase-like Zn-dependent oxidoreductase
MWIRLGLSRFTSINFMPSQRSIVSVQPNSDDLATIAKLVDEGKLTVVLDSIVPFEESQIREAYEKLKSRRTKGKISVDLTLAS